MFFMSDSLCNAFKVHRNNFMGHRKIRLQINTRSFIVPEFCPLCFFNVSLMTPLCKRAENPLGMLTDLGFCVHYFRCFLPCGEAFMI